MNSPSLLAGFGVVFADGFQKTIMGAVTHPSVIALGLYQAAKLSGFAASKAEYVGRSLRRQETALYQKAAEIDRSPVNVKPEISLVSLIREAWRD